MKIGTEKALLFWRTSITCHLRPPINLVIFDSKERIVKSAYCVRKYVLHVPQWKYFSIQCSPTSERILLLGWFPPFVLLVGAICGWKWVWSIGGAMLKGKTEVLGEKRYRSATLYTTDPTWTGLASKVGFERPKANSFSHSRAKEYIIGSFAVLYWMIQSVPRSKHTSFLLYKPVSQCCTGK